MISLENSIFLDIFILLFLSLSALIGYKKGFTKRFVSFVFTILVFILSWIFSRPLSVILIANMNSSYDLSNAIISSIYSILFQAIAFFILFCFLTALRLVLQMFFKRNLEKVSDSFSITKVVDSILGSVLSVVKSFVIIFVLLCILVTPLVKNGRNFVLNSTIGSRIFNVVPTVGDTFLLLDDAMSMLDSLAKASSPADYLIGNNLDTLISMVSTAYELGIINEQTIVDLVVEYKDEIINSQGIVVSPKQKEEIEGVLLAQEIPEYIRAQVLEKITVSNNYE